MSTKKSTIENISFFSDGFKLKGYLHLPSTYLPPVVIGSHGLYSSSSSQNKLHWPTNAIGLVSPISASITAVAAAARVNLRG